MQQKTFFSTVGVTRERGGCVFLMHKLFIYIVHIYCSYILFIYISKNRKNVELVFYLSLLTWLMTRSHLFPFYGMLYYFCFFARRPHSSSQVYIL